MRKLSAHIKPKSGPKIAALALATGLLLSLVPPHKTDAADFGGHQPQQIVVPQNSATVDVRVQFREAVFVKVEHEKFALPLTAGEDDHGVFFRQAAVSFQGASGETAFLFCDIVSEQALFPGSRQSRSASLACDSANAAPQSVSSGTTVNTGINLQQSLFPRNGENRYISLEVAYI